VEIGERRGGDAEDDEPSDLSLRSYDGIDETARSPQRRREQQAQKRVGPSILGVLDLDSGDRKQQDRQHRTPTPGGTETEEIERHHTKRTCQGRRQTHRELGCAGDGDPELHQRVVSGRIRLVARDRPQQLGPWRLSEQHRRALVYPKRLFGDSE